MENILEINYSSISSAALSILNQQTNINIDPTKNAKNLEQILQSNGISNQNGSKLKRYQPLNENYKDISSKISMQLANPSKVK